MPSVYLSPSVAEYEFFATGGSEEYYMNRIADVMIPYLRASGIDFDRNDPGYTPSQIMAKSNSQYHDLHLVLNMESGVGDLAGKVRGESTVHYTGSPGGTVAADIFAENLKMIYPIPQLVTVASDRLNPELRDTNAAALMVVLGYRDNIEDAKWVVDHIDEIGRNLAMSIAEYLKVPFVEKTPAAGSRRY